MSFFFFSLCSSGSKNFYLQHQLRHLVLLLQLLAVRYGPVVEQAHHAVLLQGLPVVLVVDVQDTVFAVILRELQALLGWRQGHEAQARQQEQEQGEHLLETPRAREGKGPVVAARCKDAQTEKVRKARGKAGNATGCSSGQSWSFSCSFQASQVKQRNPTSTIISQSLGTPFFFYDHPSGASLWKHKGGKKGYRRSVWWRGGGGYHT